ncbi:MAG: serine hydrolase, partial [Actinomycetota bacterium]
MPRVSGLVTLGLLAVGLIQPASLGASPRRYAETARSVERLVEHELAAKQIPALSVALVDDQQIVWSKGFGYADPHRKVRATANTVHRVGSVSKLFTDLAVMQLVERGELDLDAPVTRYLPDFRPRNPFGGEITLRQLMAHRAGLVREPPVGNYFDASSPTLAATVESLNRTELVYAPGANTKYSNAGIAVVGRVLEKVRQQPFAPYLRGAVLAPLGMAHSSFEPTPAVKSGLAKASMWTLHRGAFPAPTFELGMAPAGSLYSTATDLGRFASALIAGGEGRNGRLLKRETLEAMWKPQFAPAGAKEGFGLGFHVSELDGHRSVSHGGAIYGFATTFMVLPERKLAAVVISSLDLANSVTDRVAEHALRGMLAAQDRKPTPEPLLPEAVAPDVARRLQGRYERDDGRALELRARAGKLYAYPREGFARYEVRSAKILLIADDPLRYNNLELTVRNGKLAADSPYRHRVPPPPAPAPERWRGLIGEYGWDHNTLYLLEKDGKLCALVEWFFLGELEEVSADVFRFGTTGLYEGEMLRFKRDAAGKAVEVDLGSVLFPRRKLDGEDGATFRIQPQKPVDQLRAAALSARPPKEPGAFVRTDLVDLATLDPTIRFDIRYAGTNNFVGAAFYRSPRAFLQRPAAEALLQAHRWLALRGYGLMVFDAYRPWNVTKMFWHA